MYCLIIMKQERGLEKKKRKRKKNFKEVGEERVSISKGFNAAKTQTRGLATCRGSAPEMWESIRRHAAARVPITF